MIRFTLEEITEKSAKNRAAHGPGLTEEQLQAIALRNGAREIKPLGVDDPEALKRPKPMTPGSTRDVRKVKRAKKAVPTEHQSQVSVIQWWDAWGPANGYDKRLLFAIPNGSNKSMQQAVRFRDEGLRAGCPDLMLALPMKPCLLYETGERTDHMAGLFIEMKRENAPPSSVKPEQAEYHDLLSKQGYSVSVCYGAQQAIDCIKGYLCTK